MYTKKALFSKLAVALRVTLIGVIVFGQALSAAPAVEAVGATGLTLTVTSDDTSVLASDASATNGLVPAAGGRLAYQWGWSDPQGSSATFSQTLPAGLLWADESVATGCTRTGTLSTGQTLTCVISGLSGVGSTTKVANVYNLANGTSISSYLVSGDQTSATTSVTVAARPAVTLELSPSGPSFSDGLDPEAPGTEAGLKIPFTFALSVPRTSTDGAKGAESLQSPISFTATLPSGSKLYGCSGTQEFRREPYPLPTPGASGSATRPPDSGTISCVSSGSTATITVTGADTSFLRFPTQSYVGTPLSSSGPGYFSVGGFYIWRPLTDFTVGVGLPVTTTVSGMSVTGISGQTTAVADATATSTVVRSAASLNLSTSTTGSIMIGSTVVNNGTVYPGSDFTTTNRLSTTSGSGLDLTGTTLCQTWDNSLATIRNTTNPIIPSAVVAITPALTVSDFQVEYGTNTYADETARKAADCGQVGDGSPAWYTSIAAASAAPGGLAAVSAIRIKYLRDFHPSEEFDCAILYTASTDPGLPVKTKIPVYSMYWSDQTTIVRSTWISQAGTLSADTGYAGSGNRGGQVTLSTAQVRATTNIASTDIKPGNSTTVTIQPVVSNPVATDGRPALATIVTTHLLDGCMAYVPGATAATSVVPSTPGTPGVGQTCRNVAGQTITWNLGDVATTPAVTEAPIVFGIAMDPMTPAPYLGYISTSISSDSDLASSGQRSSSDTTVISSVSEFLLTQSASSTTGAPGVPITYRVGWANGLLTPIGQAWIIDVLPYNGDGRGTIGAGPLTVNSVITVPSGLPVEYTTLASDTLASRTTTDPTGNTGISWTSTPPVSGVTGIRIRTQYLNNGDTGHADISLTPTSLSMNGKLVNDINGKADEISATALGLSPLTVNSSSASIGGTIYRDVDGSATQNTGDTPLSEAVVTLHGYNFGPNGTDDLGFGDDITVADGITATSNDSGAYAFETGPGKYTFTASRSGYTLVAGPAVITVAASVSQSGKNFLFLQNIAPLETGSGTQATPTPRPTAGGGKTSVTNDIDVPTGVATTPTPTGTPENTSPNTGKQTPTPDSGSAATPASGSAASVDSFVARYGYWILGLLALLAFFWFFILAKRRRKKEEEEAPLP